MPTTLNIHLQHSKDSGIRVIQSGEEISDKTGLIKDYSREITRQ